MALKSALRLVVISSFLSLLLGMGWLSFKVFEGSNAKESATSWNHPLAQLKVWDLHRPSQCEDPAALKKEVQKSSQEAIWFFDIQTQKDGWIVFCNQGSSGDLFQPWQKGLALKDFLSLFADRQHFLILNIHASQKPEAEDLLKLMKDFVQSDHIGVVSPSRLPLEAIRKERPQWFFGADRTTLTKVQAFRALRLIGLLDLWADFYILSKEDRQNLPPNVLEFLNKQDKVLIKEILPEELVANKNADLYRGFLFVNK